jgi:hypothetical protein
MELKQISTEERKNRFTGESIMLNTCRGYQA